MQYQYNNTIWCHYVRTIKYVLLLLLLFSIAIGVIFVCFRECANRAVWLSLCLAVCWLMVIYATTNSISWLSTCGTWVTNTAFVTRAHRLVVHTIALALGGKYNALTSLSLSSSPGADSGVHQTSGAAGRHEPSLWHDGTSVSAVQSLTRW